MLSLRTARTVDMRPHVRIDISTQEDFDRALGSVGALPDV